MVWSKTLILIGLFVCRTHINAVHYVKFKTKFPDPEARIVTVGSRLVYECPFRLIAKIPVMFIYWTPLVKKAYLVVQGIPVLASRMGVHLVTTWCIPVQCRTTGVHVWRGPSLHDTSDGSSCLQS